MNDPIQTESVLGDVFSHFLIGVGLCAAAVLYSVWRNQRRRLFRFGGSSPASLGTENRWLGWFLFSYALEWFFSFWFYRGGHWATELGFSLLQAPWLALGLFLIDRLAMAFLEPKSHWLDAKTNLVADLEEWSVTVDSEEKTPAADSTYAREKLASWLNGKLSARLRQLFSFRKAGSTKRPAAPASADPDQAREEIEAMRQFTQSDDR